MRFRADGVFTTCITNIITLFNGTLCAAGQNERKRLRFRAEFAQPVDQADAQRRFIITYYTVRGGGHYPERITKCKVRIARPSVLPVVLSGENGGWVVLGKFGCV